MTQARTWTRPKYVPGGGDAHVAFTVYTMAEVAGLTASRSRHGIPEAASRYPIRLDHFARSEHPRRFDALQSKSLLTFADDEGLDIDALGAASHQVAIDLPMPDPADAEHLRLVWGFVRALCGNAQVVGILDVHAQRWWSVAAVDAIPVTAPFDPRREISVVFDTDPAPGFQHVCHTRGLRKLGRPDVILTGLTERHSDLAGQVLHEVATHLALGAIVSPGDTLRLRLGSGRVSRYVPGGNAPELYLGNRGLVI